MLRLLVPLLLLFGGSGLAQQHRFENLARTQEPWLLRQLEGRSDLTPVEIRQRIVNLPAFADAQYAIDSSGGQTVLNWTTEEARTRFPLIDFGGLRGNVNFLLGYKDLHFRGRGEELTAFYQNNDGEHNFRFAFRNPNPCGSRFGYGLAVQRYASREPLYFGNRGVNYRYANLTFGVSLSYQLRVRDHLTLGTSTFSEDYLKLPDQEETPGPEGLRLRKYGLRLAYSRDRRDFHGERRTGWQQATSFQTVLTAGQTQGFVLLLHDITYHQLVGTHGNLAARLRAGISTNDDTPFAPFVLDSQVNIRGSGNRIDRGTAQFVLNSEYRHSVFRNRRDRYVIQLVGFSDFGTWRNPGGALGDLVADENFRLFGGGGLRVASPKVQSAVLRVDYGFELLGADRRRGVVVGFGQYF